MSGKTEATFIILNEEMLGVLLRLHEWDPGLEQHLDWSPHVSVVHVSKQGFLAHFLSIYLQPPLPFP